MITRLVPEGAEVYCTQHHPYLMQLTAISRLGDGSTGQQESPLLEP